jgi:hypothetical protein
MCLPILVQRTLRCRTASATQRAGTLRYVAASSIVKSGCCGGGVRGSSPIGSWLDLILLKDMAIARGGLDVLGFRGYVVLRG